MSVRGRLVALAAVAALTPGLAAPTAHAQSSTTTSAESPATGSTTGAGASSAAGTTTAPPGTTTSVGTTTPEITAEQAGPGILLDAADRVELASSLAEATSESGTCFGYQVVLGGDGASDRTETLSNAGPDREPTAADCPKGSVVLQVVLTYTSSSSESEDSASFSVRTDVPGLSGSVATRRVEDLSGIDDGDLVGDEDDLALRNATAALPLILDGAVPAELAAPADRAPNGDRLTGSPGSDWVRAHGVGIAIAFALLLLAVVLVVVGIAGRRRSRPPETPGPFSTTTTS